MKILSDFQVGFVLVKFIANFTQRNHSLTVALHYDQPLTNDKIF